MDTKIKILAAVLIANGVGVIICGASYLYKMAYIHGKMDGAITYCNHLVETLKNIPSSEEEEHID